MKRVFGGRDDNEGTSGDRHSESHDNGPPPDEHTRLLPNRVDSDTRPDYLSPDDPAVSPYNLFTVRFTRYVTIFFTIVTFLWWVLQLVSIFITPPGLSTRGSGFFGFSYSSIALSTLIVTLLFFAAPSKAARILSAVASVLLLANVIINVSVQKTRHEEAWTGIASVVWAFLMAVWSLSADRIVQWGKREEEERLTGREEPRRTLLEWTRVLLSTIGFAVLAVVALLLTFTLILRAVDAKIAPPGDLYSVDGDKYQIHLYCRGNETDSKGNKLPTVLFEGGEDPVEDGLWQFADNALKNGSLGRYCFADRPGFAWSDTAPSPFSASQATEALSEALAHAGETGPWILASAGIGSIYSRVFSSRHGKEIKGLVLIDPLHEDLLHRIAAPGRGFTLWLRGVISPLGLDRIPGALFNGRTSEDRVYGRASYQTGKQIFARLQESLVADSLTKRDVASSRAIQAPDVPLVVISSAIKVRTDSQWEGKQRDLTHLTENLHDWDIVNKAPHQVWKTLDGREVIEKRIRQLVQGK
ncbi:mitochondrial integral membrane protein [Diaporthe sp. PMI_573]|nr:mitochondrial integral membrane protein [Diaporthaceae sp. PMI_573]